MKPRFLYYSLLVVTSSAHGQVTSVVPNVFSASPAASTFLSPLSTSARRYMLLIDESQLTAHVGRKINGIAMRNPGSATAAWPPADLAIGSYEIKMAPSVDPSARSLTFASNYAGSVSTVKTGALNVAAGAYGFGATPNAFGPTIAFDTPYSYNGGDLLVEILNGGFSGTSRSQEATAATGGPSGIYGVLVSGLWTGTAGSATGSQGNAVVMQFRSVPSGPTLVGDITLLNSDSDWANEIVTIQLVDAGSNTLMETVTATLGASGSYSVGTTVPIGNYDIYVRGDTFLKKKVATVSLLSGTNTVNATLKNGDVNGDNEVGAADFSLMAASYDLTTGDPGFSAAADLNDDGEVGAADFSILAGAYDEVGDDF